MLISACFLQFSQFRGEFGWKKARGAIGVLIFRAHFRWACWPP